MAGIEPERPLVSLSMDQWTDSEGLISNNLTFATQTSSKFIWITSFNGILRFDGLEFELFDKQNLPILTSNGFYEAYEDSKGNILFPPLRVQELLHLGIIPFFHF